MSSSPVRCYHPLKGFVIGLNPDTGKKKIVIRSETSEFVDPYLETIDIPCGKCIGCRMRQSREWANRLILEKSLHEQSWFVTLTFDEDSLNEKCLVSSLDDNGNLQYAYSLKREHIKKFMKDLRQKVYMRYSMSDPYFPKFFEDVKGSHWRDNWKSADSDSYWNWFNNIPKIRFFACGEYGDESGRPHYHVILFGLNLDENDLVFRKKSRLGDDYFNSRLIDSVWPYGIAVVANVSWRSCAYVARYVMKKYGGDDAEVYEKHNILQPFVQMSRRPGIASDWFDQNIEKMYMNKIIVPDEKVGKREFVPPSYFMKKFEFVDPEEYAFQKQLRRDSALHSEKIELSRTGKSKEDYLCGLEKNFQHATDFLNSCRQFESLDL